MADTKVTINKIMINNNLPLMSFLSVLKQETLT